MKRLLLATCLILSSGPAGAEWDLAAEGGGAKIYIDFDSIRRRDVLVKIWELYDYETARSVNGTTYLSMKRQSEYDCAEERARFLAMTAFSDHMGTGDVVKSIVHVDKWSPVEPQSVGQALWEVVCPTKKPSNKK